MRRILIILLLICPYHSFSQQINFDHHITERYVTCSDVSLNADRIINEFYQRKEYDSLNYFLDYYDQKCRNYSWTFQLRTMIQLQQRTFDIDSINKDFLNRLERLDVQKNYTRNGRWNPYAHQNPNPEKTIIENVMNQLKKTTDETNRSLDETFLIGFLNDSIYSLKDLKKEQFKNSKLAKLFESREKEFNKISEQRIGISMGAIFSTQKTKYINPSPSLGIEFGARSDKHHIQGVFYGDFGELDEAYFVLDENNLISTEHWSQVQLILEYGYEFFQPKFAQFIVWGGAGYSYMYNRLADEEKDIEKIGKGSINLCLGIGAEKKFENWYLGLQAKYNYTNYKYDVLETPVYGNYISVRLIAGLRTPAPNYYAYSQLYR